MDKIKSEKKLNEIEIDELIKFVYNKVAEWHNDEASSEELKHISIEIIQECINSTLEQIGISEVSLKVKVDKQKSNSTTKT